MKLFYSQKDNYWRDGTINECENQNTADLLVLPQEKQKLLGLGACFNELGMISLETISEKDRNILLDELFLPDKGLGFEYCRLPIGASDYAEFWYSHNEVADDYEMEHFSIERDKKYLIPYIKEALNRNPNIKLFASPWSPPSWMKFPKSYNYGKLVWVEKNLTAYALYLTKFIEEYKKEGITIHQLHIQNEVIADQKFPSCVWTGEELCEFIGDYLGPMFEKHNIDTEIWLGTMNCPEYEKGLNNDFNDYAFYTLTNEKAKKYIKGASYQWAGKLAIQRFNDSFPNVPFIQSENECGDGTNTWEYAKYIFGLMRHYLRNGAVGYIYWNMILKPKGLSTWGWNQNSMISIDDEKVIYNPEYYVMKHLAEFVGKDSIYLDTQGVWSANSIAFKNSKGDKVIVILNPLKEEKDIILNCDNKLYSFELKANSISTIII